MFYDLMFGTLNMGSVMAGMDMRGFSSVANFFSLGLQCGEEGREQWSYSQLRARCARGHSRGRRGSLF